MGEVLKQSETIKEGLEIDFRLLTPQQLEEMKDQFLALYNDAEHVLNGIAKEEERREKKDLSWD